METPETNVAVVMELYGITSRRQLARLFDVTPTAANRWFHGNTPPPVELADWAGVSYDWMRGKSPDMWGYEMIELRRRLRQYFAGGEYRAWSIGNRFRSVVSWILDQETFITIQMLSMYLRISEETLQAVIDGDAHVEWPTVVRLSEYLDIPKQWFEDGSPRHLVGNDRYDKVVQRLMEGRFDPNDVMRMLDVMEASGVRL